MKLTYNDVRELAPILHGTVDASTTDGNGHMNVRHFYGAAVTAADTMLESVGVDDGYRGIRQMGAFAAEHHIRYLAEMNLGDRYSAHGLWLDRSSRAGHFMVFVLNATTRTLACSLELLVVNVSLTSRKPEPFPADVTARIDAGITVVSRLDWTASISRSMRVRQSA